MVPEIKLAHPTINDVNQLLEDLLLKELPLKKNGIEISFDQPNREWSARLNGPTISLFLYDIRKNKFRQGQWEAVHRNGRVIKQRPPHKIDLQYMVTAWVVDGDPDEEHYLLTATLMALARHPNLPDQPDLGTMPEESLITLDFLPEGLQTQPGPIAVAVAEPEALLNPVDIWSSLDNEIRPSITCLLTIAMDVYAPISVPLPAGKEVRMGSLAGGDSEETAKRPYFNIEGDIIAQDAFENVQVVFMRMGQGRRGISVPVRFNSGTHRQFLMPRFPIGDYSLRFIFGDQPPIPVDFMISGEGEVEKELKEGISLKLEIKKVD